ncbi:ribosome alternative rescue factor ArfA [Photobacterium ganghwense]|uniref:Ribosome alternative rescue factor ArfA n=1 Tax=Photobacterium ganghwense TaxID=320778 RepID=A0A0J1H8B4_9GAMM|nr:MULTISPECIES: ribosome alternative rescue factor ArfA [Photobacterium]KLV07928.1 hypothetical protein ABT57_13815 [Photobacterium ganghwense]MBV1843218.1 ribosome alternative rescue factor ArfA [Photobacterium ganghwense]PSU07030.1 ribosome alternative rescue factor ArfA [Photobacterium ganghwense]QSV15784.1 ribosome alternative rescue factor ArfA [Photobacterium ganghwense]
MAKHRKAKSSVKDTEIGHELRVNDTEFGRGTIRDNALKAVVTSQLFRSRVEKAKKGKGSFNRKAKHAGRESYPMAA